VEKFCSGFTSKFDFHEHPMFLLIMIMWAFTFVFAFNHCVIQGLPFFEVQPLHIISGTIVFYATVIPALLDRI